LFGYSAAATVTRLQCDHHSVDLTSPNKHSDSIFPLLLTLDLFQHLISAVKWKKRRREKVIVEVERTVTWGERVRRVWRMVFRVRVREW